MAHPLQGVRDALALGPQFLPIGHVPELTAAALAVEGTVGRDSLRRGEEQLHTPAPGYIFIHLLQPDLPPLPPDGEGHKDYPALQPGHPHPLGGAAGNLQRMDRVFSDVNHRKRPLQIFYAASM